MPGFLPRVLPFVSLLWLGAMPPLPVLPPWNDSGHQIIARRAWAELAPATRAQLGELLRQHPRYEADLLFGLPEGSDAAATAAHAFAVACTWPDVVRSVSHPMHRVAHHGPWHYKDIPLVLQEQKLPAPAPAPASAGDAAGPRDLLEALAKCRADLADANLPAADRAVALCWVLHLTADLHQPLHACTLYSPQFPLGDKGGNSFLVLGVGVDPGSRTNLHSVWDGLLGGYKSAAFDAAVAAGLALQPGLARADFAARLAVRDPAVWLQESHDLAVEYAYLRGDLKGAAAGADGKAPQEQVPPLPKGYLAAAETVAMRQAALAAYRLAASLDAVFAPK